MDASTRQLAKQLLAKGHNKTEVAEECGVSRRTIIRWSQEPDFMTFADNADNADNSYAEKAENVATVELIDDSLDNLLNDCDDPIEALDTTPISEILKPDTEFTSITYSKPSTEQKIKYLTSVKNKQMLLSSTADNHALQLLQLCGQIISELQKHPEELNARMLPQLVKAVDTVNKIAKETRERAGYAEGSIESINYQKSLGILDIEF